MKIEDKVTAGKIAGYRPPKDSIPIVMAPERLVEVIGKNQAGDKQNYIEWPLSPKYNFL